MATIGERLFGHYRGVATSQGFFFKCIKTILELIITINDLPQSVGSSSMLLFADDAKCFRPITNPSDCSLLQDDLYRLLDWSNKWKLHFNISKCALVRFSYGTPISPASSYCMGDQDIVALDCLRDLGVLISDDLSWSAHYDLLCSRAYKILGLLRRVFNNVFAIAAKKHLYISLVRSQLTYCSVVWRPHLIKDITTLEKIQRRASKYILSDFSSDYKSRLTSLNMLPSMMQLELYDILSFIKSLKYPSESFNILDFVSFCSGSSRSAAHLKLQLSPANRSTNRIRHFYFSRLPHLWNYLPTINLEKSVMSIKSDITAFFWSRFQQTFDPSRPCTYHAVCPCARVPLYLYLTTLIWLLAPTSRPSVQNSFVLLFYFVIIITPIPVLSTNRIRHFYFSHS